MSNERPTSVSVVSWFFIISGLLAVLSAIGYVFVAVSEPNTASPVWKGVLQILIAAFLVVAGIFFLKGSAKARLFLEYSTYALAFFFLSYSVALASTWGYGPLFGAIVYLVPLFFINRALRNPKVVNFVN